MDWKFDSSVAEIFSGHARQHIPDYDRVIGLTVDLCKQKLSMSDPILEIGCAVGETVTRLHYAGFTNIHAVDSSQAMLDHCPKNFATYYCTENFPVTNTKFNAVLCNWTLHFIRNKHSYMEQIFNSMEPGGFLILSEKTVNEGLALEQYHRFKSAQGVSDEAIKAKAESLKNTMFVHNPVWYLENLQVAGFKKVYIANASWCFTTFVAVK